MRKSEGIKNTTDSFLSRQDYSLRYYRTRLDVELSMFESTETTQKRSKVEKKVTRPPVRYVSLFRRIVVVIQLRVYL